MSTDLMLAILGLLVVITLFLVWRVLQTIRSQNFSQEFSRELLGVRQSLQSVVDLVDRSERLQREELLRARGESRIAAKELREELGHQLHGLQDSFLRNSADLQMLEKAQLELFAKQLTEGVGQIELRVAELSRHLQEMLATARATSQSEQEALRERLEARLLLQTQQSQDSDRALREEVQVNLKRLGEALSETMDRLALAQREQLQVVAKEIVGLTEKHDQTQERLRLSVEQKLETLRTDNADKLESIRKTVDEQLQGTLEKRLGESFKLVSERLEQVHKGLGEMQTLASGVGDLKRVLTNVKTRGTWGEVQLGHLLDQVLTPDQYLRDAQTRPGSLERVEYAIRLPGKGDGDEEVLLPIDAKFPHEDYERLQLAAERADHEAVEQAARQLEVRIKNCAREIHDKYINPPHTTDFAILFLPTEGLYAEVLRRPGLLEWVQREWRVSISGPTTLAATLNALQMGFRTLAIQRRSSEVWQVLEAVKTEFSKYGQVLDKVQRKLSEASKTIDDVSIRRRAIDRKLRSIGTVTDTEAAQLLGLDDLDPEGPPSGLADSSDARD